MARKWKRADKRPPDFGFASYLSDCRLHGVEKTLERTNPRTLHHAYRWEIKEIEAGQRFVESSFLICVPSYRVSRSEFSIVYTFNLILFDVSEAADHFKLAPFAFRYVWHCFFQAEHVAAEIFLNGSRENTENIQNQPRIVNISTLFKSKILQMTTSKVPTSHPISHRIKNLNTANEGAGTINVRRTQLFSPTTVSA